MSLCFFLGGHDLEMVEIGKLARSAGSVVVDKGLPWGAKLSDYEGEIEAHTNSHGRAIAVELIDDMPANWSARPNLVLVDHHGPRAAEPSSLEQVFAILKLPPSSWSRRLQLVAANDKAYVEGLLGAGASWQEAASIRMEDRAAQGITPQQEAQGLAALAQAQVLVAKLTYVKLQHNHMATVTDPAALNTKFRALPANLFIHAPQEFGFFGEGRAVLTLANACSIGWSGGNLPQKGFWGAPADQLNETELLHLILDTI